MDAIRAPQDLIDGSDLVRMLRSAPLDPDRPGYRRLSLLDLKGANIHGEFKLPPTIALERVDLEGTTFHDSADFSRSAITGPADFTNTVFLDKAMFREMAFEDTAQFSGASFSDSADFSDAVFARDASFECAQFDNEVRFHRTRFKQTCLMPQTRFLGNVGFYYARFSDKWSTAGAWCGANFNCHGIACEQVDGMGKLQVDGIANFHESRWQEHVSMDLRAPQISYEKATFQQGFDLIASGCVDLSQVRVGAASRVRGGLFWHMDSDHYVTDSEGEAPMATVTSLRGADARGSFVDVSADHRRRARLACRARVAVLGTRGT